MIYSMTAFGRTQIEEAGYSVTVEIRSLNGRSLDIVLRLPKNYLEFEDSLRKLISQSARRGRIEVFVAIETSKIEQKAPRLNFELARLYWDQLLDLHRQLPGSNEPRLEHILGIPYIFESREPDLDRDVLKQILTVAVTEALDQLLRMRAAEGDALHRDCLARLDVLHEEIESVEARKDLIVQEYRNRLSEKIQELLGDTEPDESRLLQEVAYFAERSDINEEIVRLKSHLDQMRATFASATAADGRSLDFLAQEMHREVNTIGCKTGDLETTRTVVKMKSEIGKLKEQVQNIE